MISWKYLDLMIMWALKNKGKLSANNPNVFTFSPVLLENVKKEIMNFDVEKFTLK